MHDLAQITWTACFAAVFRIRQNIVCVRQTVATHAMQDLHKQHITVPWTGMAVYDQHDCVLTT